MPGVLFRLDGAVGRVQLRLPLPEVLLLGQLARYAQLIKHRGIGGSLVEIGGVEVPQRAISGVVECQPVIGVEHGDTGRKLIEGAAVRVDHARHRAAHGFRFGGVDTEAGAAGLGAKVEHIEALPRSGDNGGQPAGIRAVRACAPA